MVASADEKPDPIVEMMSIDNEAERHREPPAGELDIAPPEDKKEPERDEAGKFKAQPGKEGEKPADKPEAKADAKAESEKPEPEKKNDTVPLAKYMEEKRQLRAELEARDLTIKQFNEKLAALEAKLPKAAEAPEPDFVEDPKAYVDHKLNKALDGIAEANKKADASGEEARKATAQNAEVAQLQRFNQDLQAHEQRFVATTPDYYDALAHVRNVRAAQLREFTPDITDAQIREQIVGEETQMAFQLARQGRDPVQTAYNLARHYGYQPKAKEEAAPAPLPAKLPDAPSKRLPPDQTLGTGAGGTNDGAYREGEVDPVDVALASLFKRRA